MKILIFARYDNKLFHCLFIQVTPCKQLYLYDLSNAQFLEANTCNWLRMIKNSLTYFYLYNTLHVNEIMRLLCVKINVYCNLYVKIV